MSTVPFALVGGFWLIWILGHAVSVATAVGFIALSGVAAEFGVVMLLYLKGALNHRLEEGEPFTEATLVDAIREGAVLRVRPKAMTVAVVLAGLIPIMLGHGSGSEVMQRIAAPMVGGMVTAPLLSMLIIPAAWLLLQRRRVARMARLCRKLTLEKTNEETDYPDGDVLYRPYARRRGAGGGRYGGHEDERRRNGCRDAEQRRAHRCGRQEGGPVDRHGDAPARRTEEHRHVGDDDGL
jgi:hypothetical protein